MTAWIALKTIHIATTVNDRQATSGRGADVLGGPLVALTWLANSHRLRGCGLRAGDMVTTGVCGAPAPIAPGDHVRADFGVLGTVHVDLHD